MKPKKILAVGCMAAIMAVSEIGCGAERGNEKPAVPQENQTAPAAVEEEQTKAGTKTVQVTAVEGNTITAETGTIAAGQGGSFGGSGECLVFEVTDDTEIVVEFLRGSNAGSLDDVRLGSVLEVTTDDAGAAVVVAVKNVSAENGFGGSGEVTNGTAATTIDADGEAAGQTYRSDGNDENALRVDGAAAGFSEITVNKTGGESSNTEDGDFYGQNAGFLAINGAQVTIENATVTTDALNGNGVFSYGEGTVVTIADSTIRTLQNNSGGIQTAGGGTTNAVNLDVETQGSLAAAIRSGRGGGTVSVEGGNYVTNGIESPAVYCAADISVSEAELLANASEGIVVEGNHSVRLTDCTVTGNMKPADNGTSDGNVHCVMICQNLSGEADVGTAIFSADGGSITSLSGDMFYVTNADCEIYLSEVVFTMINDVFLRVEGNHSGQSGGAAGATGGNVALVADSQDFSGNIFVDETSCLSLAMKNGTAYSGAVNPGGAGGEVAVSMDKTSYWTLTADSYITGLEGGTGNIDANGYHLYVDGKEIL